MATMHLAVRPEVLQCHLANKTIALFLRYKEMEVENRRFEPTPPLFGAPVGG